MKILVAGDYVPQHRVLHLIQEKRYNEVFGAVKRLTNTVDYSIVNMECPYALKEAVPIVKTGPNLKCESPEMIDSIKWMGFDCVTLANNHFRDYGDSGVKQTLEALSHYSLNSVGGGLTLEDAEQTLYKDINGKVLAIINCCEHEWSIATNNHGGSNPLNPIKQYYCIQEAKQKADHVIVIVHGGAELHNLPLPRMKETYRFFIDAGADIVVNHHQHCFSGYEIYNGKTIFYGLGNFCFDRQNAKDCWYEGYLALIHLKEENIVFTLIPYEQCKSKPEISILDHREEFDNRINQLNSIISDNELLLDSFHRFSAKREQSFKNLLEPYRSSISKTLLRKGLLPSFATPVRLKYLLGHIQCESHKDVMNNCLEQIISRTQKELK